MPLTVSTGRALNRRWWVTLLAGLLLALAGMPAGARAAAPAPSWQLRAIASPTAFSAQDTGVGGGDEYELMLTNLGGAPTDGTPVVVTGTPPPGVMFRGEESTSGEPGWTWSCTSSPSSFTCEYPRTMASLERTPELAVMLEVDPGVPADTVADTTFHVSGGGAIGVSTSASTVLNPSALTPFGLQDVFSLPADAEGALDTAASAHPHSLSIGFDFTSAVSQFLEPVENSIAVEDVRDVVVDLPVGFSGNPQALPQCPISALIRFELGINESNCPVASQVGTIDINVRGSFEQTTSGGFNREIGEFIPVFNMVPERGHPAELGTSYAGYPVLMYPSVVGSGADAHLRVEVPGVPSVSNLGFLGAQLTLYGDPAEQAGGATAPAAFLTNPSWCSGEPLTTTVYGDSYEHRGRHDADGSPDLTDPAWVRATTTTAATSGCGALHFKPSMGVRPETTQADAPAGARIDFGFPQNPDPRGLATPPLRDASVALPTGMALSPPAADGLQACGDAQFAAASHDPASCPPGSQVGTVTARTPLLADPLEGQLFVASPECAPCTEGDAQSGRMVRLFMQLEGPGVVLKFPGTVSVDPGSGRLTAVFKDLIQQPVREVQVQLKGGPRAPFATPQTCGAATTTSDLAPWSAPETPAATPSSSFEVDWDGAGGACPGDLPFSPGFEAGVVTPIGGGFTPFTLTFSRHDREQGLSGITVNTPPGLLGVLKSVVLCAEPQAAQGTCAAASQIGTTAVAVGPGSHPLWVQGKVFLTNGYRGQPFGLSVVVPAVAGPFNLGTVVVRASIHVDEHTAALSIASDPFPTALDGVPLRIQTVNVTVDRPGFVFNPTNCARTQVAGTIASTQGTSTSVSSSFALGGCANLPFRPSFKVSTQAKTSKKNGASLGVKVGSGQGQANIGKVAVSLPRQLPSRLTTIQQACPEATFNANPASCPVGSNIGTATASTPVLSTPLVGPAYLVSHGGAAFPDLVLILQGEGVTLDLVGSIDIRKGVTSSTFASVPDAPISTFELKLPEGPHSGLAAVVPAKAKGNLCGQSLVMPTTITGQNGAQVKQSTKIAVTGCPKAKKKAKTKRGKKPGHAKKGK